MELWFTEKHTPNTSLSFKVKEVLYSSHSKFQDIKVIETYDWGKVLLLDGLVMLTEKDEFIYHEMIVHPLLFTHPNPSRVLVIGGGDGGTIREVSRHKEVKVIELCEIDDEVIKVSKEFFPQLAHSFYDPRVKIHIEEGSKFLKHKNSIYDIIIVDSTDPTQVCESLYSEEFYHSLFESIKEDGMIVIQSESIIITPQRVKDIYVKVRNIFPQIWLYLVPIPTYPGGIWSFTLASKRYSPLENFNRKRWENFPYSLKYFTPEVMRASFSLPPFVKKIIEEEK